MSHAPAPRQAELKHCLQISLSHLLWEYKGCGARVCWVLECCCSWSSTTATALPGHHHASTPTKAGQPLGLQNNLPLKSVESQSARTVKRLTENKAARILFYLHTAKRKLLAQAVSRIKGGFIYVFIFCKPCSLSLWCSFGSRCLNFEGFAYCDLG